MYTTHCNPLWCVAWSITSLTQRRGTQNLDFIVWIARMHFVSNFSIPNGYLWSWKHTEAEINGSSIGLRQPEISSHNVLVPNSQVINWTNNDECELKRQNSFPRWKHYSFNVDDAVLELKFLWNHTNRLITITLAIWLTCIWNTPTIH